MAGSGLQSGSAGHARFLRQATVPRCQSAPRCDAFVSGITDNEKEGPEGPSFSIFLLLYSGAPAAVTPSPSQSLTSKSPPSPSQLAVSIV